MIRKFDEVRDWMYFHNITKKRVAIVVKCATVAVTVLTVIINSAIGC